MPPSWMIERGYSLLIRFPRRMVYSIFVLWFLCVFSRMYESGSLLPVHQGFLTWDRIGCLCCHWKIPWWFRVFWEGLPVLIHPVLHRVLDIPGAAGEVSRIIAMWEWFIPQSGIRCVSWGGTILHSWLHEVVYEFQGCRVKVKRWDEWKVVW